MNKEENISTERDPCIPNYQLKKAKYNQIARLNEGRKIR